jgi:hypothetical protein
MHADVEMTEKRKQAKPIVVLSWAVTIDTTNKETRPEVPRQAKGELVKLSSLLVPC